MEQPDLLTATQAGKYLGLTRQRINLLTKEGYGKRYGSVWMFTREELDRWRALPPKGPGGRPPKAHAGTLTELSPAAH